MDLLKFRVLKRSLEKDKLTLKVASDSMEPVIKSGQIISVQKTHIRDLKKFDIIVFWQEGELYCHFLWSLQNDPYTGEELLITKSLKEPKEIDIPIKEDLMLGRINVTIPLHHKITTWLRNLL